uniref:beta-mannosidase n=1 Tax=Acrobeloides nanus TaxID=290746 RepID=A0A914DW41_9BILA
MTRVLVLFFNFINFVLAGRLVLDGSDWTYHMGNGSMPGKAVVPGDIYTDLFNNGVINNPLYGSGDQDYKWVGRTSWVYEKIFTLPADAANNKEYVLVFESLDTIVTATLNGQQIFESRNMFVPVYVSVNNIINPTGSNNLSLVFQSPVMVAMNMKDDYTFMTNHDLPRDCQTPTGECFVNFIRKTQSSFSWDWGPTFATIGVAGSAYLEYFNDATIYMVSPLITYDGSNSQFNVQVDVLAFCHKGSSVTIDINVPGVLSMELGTPTLDCQPGIPKNITLVLPAKDSSVQRWWPNGYGNQTLYTLNTTISVNSKIFT